VRNIRKVCKEGKQGDWFNKKYSMENRILKNDKVLEGHMGRKHTLEREISKVVGELK